MYCVLLVEIGIPCNAILVFNLKIRIELAVYAISNVLYIGLIVPSLSLNYLDALSTTSVDLFIKS